MFNQVFLVGKLSDLPNEESSNNINHDSLIHLEVYKPYDGYNDYSPYVDIPVVIWQGMAKKILSSAKVGSFLAVKGRLLNDADDPKRGVYVRGETVKVLDYELAELKEGE